MIEGASEAMYKIHKEASLLLSNLNHTKETVKLSKEFIKIESTCVDDIIEYLTNYQVALHKKQRNPKKPKVNTAFAKTKLIDCKLCGIFFESEEVKPRHFRCQHMTKYCCSEKNCDASFISKQKFDYHVLCHNKPQGMKHICDKCDASFLYKSQLKMHMNKHSDGKPYACEKCSSHYRNVGD